MSTKYMYPEVLEDFKTKDGKWLVKNYGGGVLMGMDIGGRWSDNLTVSKLYENSTSNVAVTMQAAYGAVISGSGDTEVARVAQSEKSIANRRVNVIGGNPAYAPGKLEKWQKSVEDNLQFMDFPDDGLVMIWELFPEYEEKLKRGFDQYVREHQLSIKQSAVVRGMYVDGYKYASDARSGARKDLNLYKPSTSDGYKYIGVNGNHNKILVLKELSNKYGALREPDGWQPVWNDRGSNNRNNYNVWIPKAPPGFVALGVYCRFKVSSQDPPSGDEAKGMVVVHRSLVESCDFEDSKVWTDAGTWSSYDLTLGRLPDQALWPARTTFPDAGALPNKYRLKTEYISSY